MDIKIINVQAQSHTREDPSQALKKAEQGKDKLYRERVEKVENATFIPMIFTTKGAKSTKTSRALSRLANKIAKNTKEKKQEVASKIATDLSYIFLKMELACIRGGRAPRQQAQYQ